MPRPTQFEGGGLGDGQGVDKFATQTAREIEEALPQAPETPIERAKEIFEEDFFGLEEIEKVFGEGQREVPTVPFSEEELIEARRTGERLVFFSDIGFLKDNTSYEITLAQLDIFQRKNFAHVLHNLYAAENFFSEEKPRVGWRLVGEEVPFATEDKDLYAQTAILAREAERWSMWARNRKDVAAALRYEEALAEWNRNKDALLDARKGDVSTLASQLAELKLNRLIRESAVEIAYRLILTEASSGKTRKMALSNTVTEGGDVICVGFSDFTSQTGFTRPSEAGSISVDFLPANVGGEGFGQTFARGPVE